MQADCHIHSNNSNDSEMTIEEICRSALSNGIGGVCITDHYDSNPKDSNFLFYDAARYFREIAAARRKYGDKLEILSGIEFSEPHLYRKLFEAMRDNYDFVLASIHWLGDTWAGDPSLRDKYSLDDVYKLHYQETIRALEYGGFDSLAHIDFPKRYLPSAVEPADLLDETVSLLVFKGIALEINTSTIRKGLSEAAPSGSILRMYANRGGRQVTIGSDAHTTQDVGAHLDRAIDLAKKNGLHQVVYRKRTSNIWAW
jgi:histidinol-phosphatase (PHP family)